MISVQLLGLPVLDYGQSDRASKAEQMLKAGFNPDEPRDAQGRWASGESSHSDGTKPRTTNQRNPLFIPAQAILVEPLIGDLPITGPMPVPGPIDIAPPVIGSPDLISPRDPASNPYPEKRKCAEEWAEASRFCYDLRKKGLLNADGYRGFGKNLGQCIRGRVSEECGGNLTA